MKFRTVIYSLLLATLCMGCGNTPSMSQLNDLEARINDAPDSVLAVLTATDMPRWGERRALYALLTVQAQDKSYIDVADDSLISIATRYYDRRGPALHRLQAFYYHGRVCTNASLRHEAMAAYTRAKEFVDEVDAPYPVGLLYLHVGILYGNDYDYQRALDNLEKAFYCFEKAEMERLAYIAKRNIGLFHLNMHHFSQADSLFNEVLAWGEEHNETSIIYSSINQLLRLYDATENTDALDSLFKRYPIETVSHNATTYGIIAHHYARKGGKEAAMATLSRAWEISTTAQDTATLWHKSYQLNKTFGRAEAALRDHEHLFALQDSTMRITLQQPLMTSQLSHYQSRLEVEELRNLNYRYLMGMAALVVIIVAVVLWMLYREVFRKKEEQVKQYIDAADQLRVTLYRKEEELDKVTDALQQQATDTASLQQRIASLFKEQYNLLDELCTTYYENPKDELRSGHIFEQVCNTINFFSSDEGYARLEAIVNDGCNDAIARLRREFPRFKETDYRLLCYFCAGFSIQTICLFTKEDSKKLWVYKSRLITRIKNSDTPSKDIILAQIPQRIR
ncbi:MAG: hypothetical protein IKL03_00635 [Bacteroidaceae bacterium]|nr:hypothetical protein [Bacteroidaceae bacterium]